MLRQWLEILFFHSYFVDGDMLWFLSCDKCTYCKSLWTKASAKCPKCKGSKGCSSTMQIIIINH